MPLRSHIQEILDYLGIDDPELLQALREEGLFEEDLLEPAEADELRVAACLMRELGVNAAGVEVALRLRRRLIVLERRTSTSLRRLLSELDEIN